MRALLRGLALLEPLTLVLLLLNLSTTHLPAFAAALGPVHGACYFGIVVLALLHAGLRPRQRLLALVPGLGGLLVDRAGRSTDPRRGGHTPARR